MLRIITGAVLVASLISINASANEVNSPIAGARINWDQFGPAFTTVLNNSTFSYSGGTGFVSSVGEALEVRQQGTGVNQGWWGNMPENEFVLWNVNVGPDITLNFDQAIYGAGVFIQSDTGAEFTAMIQAYDSTGKLLEAYTENGYSELNPGTAIYLGVQRDVADISKISFTLTAPLYSVNSLGISSVNIVADSTVVPEPRGIAMLLAGLGLVGFMPRRNKS